AGNYLTTDFIATLEYASAVLHTPLIMVLGHEKCGAVGAAIDATDNNEQFPGHIQSIATALTPAVRAVPKKPDYVATDRYNDIVRMNVILTVRELRNQTPILSRLVDSKKLKVVGGVYQLETGKVKLVA
ncbi:MAG TPA: carbonic anhydrase, partial [Nitrosomonas sp.]|nr:carbonic anhydrase [Nitrosomonas sp.]